MPTSSESSTPAARLIDLAIQALAGAPIAEIEAAARQMEGVVDAASVDAVLSAARRRDEESELLRQSAERLAEAQRLGQMGSYDWEIATDTNVWSDELYRIYGVEPQSFNASYERFLEFVHPEDRAKIVAVHQAAYETGQAFHTEERIVRPDGEVRLLATWGEVVLSPDGKPQRFRGICRDVTEQRSAEQALRDSLGGFEALVESSPDVVLVVDEDGLIAHANSQAQRVLGWEPVEILGQPIEVLLPARFHDAHRRHRDAFLADPQPRSMGVGLDLFAVHREGHEVPVDVALGTFSSASGTAVTAFVRDITERRQSEQLALRLHDEQVRRRHGLEINDNVVQGITSAIYGFEAGRGEEATQALHQTLAAARAMMNDLLGDHAAVLEAGDLRREAASPQLSAPIVPPPPPVVISGETRVLLVDDAADIRLLLRTMLRRTGFLVVGEAADGAEGARLAAELQPDLILLDLSMPVMDGLEALPLIRRDAPEATVIVLSGFDRERMEPAAIAAGAHAYFEKGSGITELTALATALRPGSPPPPLITEPAPVPAPDAERTFDELALTHELRTPLAVIQGLAETLQHGSDSLPSSAVREVLDALVRNASQMSGILDAVADASRVGTGKLDLTVEPTEVVQLIADVVADLGRLTGDRPVRLTGSAHGEVPVDRLRLRQVITNLLSNAARFTPVGTQIELRVGIEDGWFELTCEDDGPGVPPERRSELFRRFARVRDHTPGMGLGLFLSREIARAHGGDLSFREGRSGGACFVLRLPSVAAVAAPDPQPAGS